MRFNSKNLKQAAEDTNVDDLLTIVKDQRTGHNYHEEDPNQGHMNRRAALAAKHELKGCGPSCRKGCSGGYKDRGLDAPPPIAQEIFGLRKNSDGDWHYHAPSSKLRRLTTLADIANVPVVPTDFKNDERRAHNQKISDFLYVPHIEITKPKRTKKALKAGQYINREGRPAFGHPMEKIGMVKQLLRHGYNNLIEEGNTNKADYYKTAKISAAISDGIRIQPGDTRPSENEKFRHLSKGAVPANTMEELGHVIKNIVSHTQVDAPNHEDPEHARRVKDMYEGLHREAKTAEFVMCPCPHCVLDQNLSAGNAVFDVQHHSRAASDVGGISDSYYAGFPKGHSKELGEGLDGRLTDLGESAMKSPHRVWWATPDADKYIKAAVRGRQNENNEWHPGAAATAVDPRLPTIDVENDPYNALQSMNNHPTKQQIRSNDYSE
jgi:hypothetical protein